jgi:predicted transcriptional regulator
MNYDINKLMKAAQKGNMNDVMKTLNDSDAQKIKEILNDNKKLNEILNSEKAKSIMEKLKNG